MRLSIQNEHGFSMIELMIVIAIVAILTGIAFLSVDLIRREEVSKTTRELLADLQRARVDGMVTGPTSTTGPNIRGVGIRFESPSSYTTFIFNDCNGNSAYDADGCAGSTREELNTDKTTLAASMSIRIKIGGTEADPANTVLLFDRFGYPRTESWGTAELTVITKSASLSVIKCIKIDTNSIREGSWDGTNCVLK